MNYDVVLLEKDYLQLQALAARHAHLTLHYHTLLNNSTHSTPSQSQSELHTLQLQLQQALKLKAQATDQFQALRQQHQQLMQEEQWQYREFAKLEESSRSFERGLQILVEIGEKGAQGYWVQECEMILKSREVVRECLKMAKTSSERSVQDQLKELLESIQQFQKLQQLLSQVPTQNQSKLTQLLQQSIIKPSSSSSS